MRRPSPISLRPRRSIRLRLTITYGLVFLITGAVLLTIGYALVRHNIGGVRLRDRLGLPNPSTQPALPFPFGPSPEDRAYFRDIHKQLVAAALHRLLIEYVLALGLMTLISVATGWLLAGRALRPLRDITGTARRVSGENLGERIDLQGPADELKELADTFDGMMERLDHAFASQRHFVANASHELRTPLAIMRTEVDVALADPDASLQELRSMGEAVRETIDRCEHLIEGLLVLARSEAAVPRTDAIDLRALAGDCITDLRARAEEADVEVRLALEYACTRGDARLVERLVANLIDNAIRHNARGGWLSVGTRRHGTSSIITVANGGPTIDPDELPALVEPFRRLARSTSGFGLGLSIARCVAEAHGGTLVLEAPRSGGLVATALLPALDTPTAPAPPAAARPVPAAT
jgi:signal transduction histidine kinase